MTKEEVIKFIAEHDIILSKHYHNDLTRWLTHNINDEWIVYDSSNHIYRGNFDGALKALLKGGN